MSIAAFYILDKKGNIIINRHYTADLESNILEKFQSKFVSQEESSFSPYLIDEENGMVYIYYNYKDLICNVTSSGSVNA